MAKKFWSAEDIAYGFKTFLEDDSRDSLKLKCGATWPVNSHHDKELSYSMMGWIINMKLIDEERYMLSTRKEGGKEESLVGKYVKYDGRGGGHTPLWTSIFENNLIELKRLANSE